MAKPRISQPENQKDVYKFWLGLFEKVTVLVVSVVIIPSFIGALKYSSSLVAVWTGVILVLLTIMILLSRSFWYLPKADPKIENKKGKTP